VIWVAAATILVAAIGIALGMVTAGEDLSGEDAVAVAPVTGAGAEAVPADHGDEPTDDGPASVPAPADHGDEPLDDEQPRPDARREASPPTDESETVPADHGDEPLDDEQPRPDAQREASPPTDGSEPATPDPQRADALIAQAEELELPDAGEEALALYQQAFEIDPRAHEALAGMAEVYLETGRAAVAVRYAERAHRRSTRRVSYLILLGDAYLANHDIRAAQQAWLEAWELRPSERIRRRLDRVGRAPE
jgi:tetratricopeptide (TPR) repeat protein